MTSTAGSVVSVPTTTVCMSPSGAPASAQPSYTSIDAVPANAPQNAPAGVTYVQRWPSTNTMAAGPSMAQLIASRKYGPPG